MKKLNPLIIIVGIIVLILLIQSTKKTNISVLRDTLQECEDSRDYKSSLGYNCIGECKHITSSIVNCVITFSSELEMGDVGQYGYFYDKSQSCNEVSDTNYEESFDQKDKGLWDCMYTSNKPTCSDECTNLNDQTCVGDTQYKRCVYDADDDPCKEWSELKSCSSGLKCNPSGGCLSCNPNWKCTDWGNCVNDIKTRTCEDTNSCGILEGKPPISEKCSIDVVDNKCEQFYQDPKNNCKTATWVWFAVGIFGFMMVMMMVKKK